MKRRKRNIARKPHRSSAAAVNSAPVAGSASACPEPTSQALAESKHEEPASHAGFVSQNTEMFVQGAKQHFAHPASRARVEANRANSRLSTGPRTPEGKAVSSRNACKHGLSIQRHLILPGECLEDYEQLLTELHEIYDPRSRREELAVEDIAQCRWAFARFDRAESFALEHLVGEWRDAAPAGAPPERVAEALGRSAAVLTDMDHRGVTVVVPDTDYPAFDRIHRYRGYWERKHVRALAEFDRAQRARRAEAAERRAEQDARDRAESRQLNCQLARAREARQSELHELRLAALTPGHRSGDTHDQQPGETSAPDALASCQNTLGSFRWNDTSGQPGGFPESNGFVSQNPPPSSQVKLEDHTSLRA